MSTERRRAGWLSGGRVLARHHLGFGAAFAPGDAWEEVLVGGNKRGFLRRTVTIEDPASIRIEQRIAAMSRGEISWLTTLMRVRDDEGFPWVSYEITIGFRPGALWRRDDGSLRFEGVEVEVDAEPLPTFGWFPAVVTMPFTEGELLEVSRLFDTGGVRDDDGALVSSGWEDVLIGDDPETLWRVDLYASGRLSASFWLDSDRRLRRSDWRGAVLQPVAGRDDAVQGLPQDMVLLAAQRGPTA